MGADLAPPLPRLIPTASRVADHGQMRQRQRLAFVVTWLAATALATAVGFAATTTVGDVIRDAGPLGVEFHASHPAVDAPVGLPHHRTFETPAAVVSAECTGRAARLLDVRPLDGWRITDSELGPDEDVDVDLTGAGPTTLHFEIYCGADGWPRPVIEWRPSDPPTGG